MFLIIMGHIVWFRESQDWLFRLLKMLFHQGDCGVNAFFFLSAYGLCYSYKKNTIMAFYKKRFLRIFPIYVLFVLLLFLLLPSVDNRSIPSLLLLQLSGLTVLEDNTIIEWFVPALILLYLLFPIIYRLMCMMKNWKGSICLYMVLLTGLIPLFYMGVDHVHPYFLARWSAIFVGIMCYIHGKEDEKIALSLLIFCASLSLFSYQDCKFYFLIPLLIYALSLLDFEHLPLKRLMLFMGNYSLEIYLGQMIGLFWYYCNAGGSVWIDLLVGISISAISAVLFYNVQKYFWVLVDLIPVHKR